MRISVAIALGLVSCFTGACSGDGDPVRAPAHTSETPTAVIDAGLRYDAAYPKGDPSGPDPVVDGYDASAEAAAPPAPFTAPEGEWTWIDVPGNVCANGSATGVGVNLTQASDDVLIFMEGGGACWDAAGCWGSVPTAFYVAGYGKAEFDADPQRSPMLPLKRDNVKNPFHTMNMIYVPYCTGDVHAGSNLAIYQVNGAPKPTYHYGAKNFETIVARTVATFPHAKNVWIAGDSAGGFGAALNFPRLQAAYPLVRVGVLDDSGQPVQPAPDRWNQWKAAWGLKPPADCPACDGDVGAYVEYYRVTYPDSRFGLISYDTDGVISTFMGLSGADFATELKGLTARMDTWPMSGYYIIQGSLHVGMLTADSPELDTWMQRLVTYDPAWGDVKP